MKLPLLKRKDTLLADEPSRTVVVFILGLLVIAASALSVFIFARTSLRLDEAQSLFQTNRDVPGLLKLVAQDVHVPLYHILLHFWQVLFGGDIIVARLMSLVFFILTIVTTYHLGAYAYNRKVGLFAALLITLSPFMQWYGSEARMYAMLAFITALNQLYFLKIRREGQNKQWFIYTLTAIAGLHTHYFFSFVLAAEGLYFILKRKSAAGRRPLVKFISVAVVSAAALLPWLLYVRSLGTASNTQPNLPVPSSGDLFNTYAQFIFGFQIDYINTIIVSLWPIIVLLAFYALQRNRKITPDTSFFVVAAVLPVIAAFVISITLRPFYLSRYLIVALPALFIFISWVFSEYPARLRRILQTGLTLVIAGLLVVQIISPNTPVKEDYAGAAAYLNQKTSSQDVIIASAPFTIYPIEYYYTGNARVVTQPLWDRFTQGAIPAFNEQKLPEETKNITGSYQQAWLILSFDQGYNKDLKNYYDTNFQRLEARQFSKGLNVYTYRLRYDQPLTVTPVTKPE